MCLLNGVFVGEIVSPFGGPILQSAKSYGIFVSSMARGIVLKQVFSANILTFKINHALTSNGWS